MTINNINSINKTYSPIDIVFQNPLRLDIILLLRLYDELNVTQISKLLNRSKATVGRHLKALQEVRILNSVEKPSKRKINPLFYSLSDQINKFFELNVLADFNVSGDMEKNRKKLKRSLISLNTILKLLQHAMGLITPFLEHIENKLDEKELDYEFLSYLFQETALNLHHFLISEEYEDELFNIYNEFRSKIEALEEKSKKEKERSLIFVDSLLPLRDMLRYRGKKKE